MKGMGNDLIREARKRSRLTQTDLAALAGTTQSAIARLEKGVASPSFDDLIRMLRLMNLDLDFMLVGRDDSDWIQASDRLPLSAQERLNRHTHLTNHLRAFQQAGTKAAKQDPAGNGAHDAT